MERWPDGPPPPPGFHAALQSNGSPPKVPLCQRISSIIQLSGQSVRLSHQNPVFVPRLALSIHARWCAKARSNKQRVARVYGRENQVSEGQNLRHACFAITNDVPETEDEVHLLPYLFGVDSNGMRILAQRYENGAQNLHLGMQFSTSTFRRDLE